MLAGVAGIDAVIFVVAADEGVMPQTREHLAILDLLEVPAGMVVITKVDLVSDPDWLKLVEDDIRSITKGTVLENVPFVRFSAISGQGLEEIKRTLRDILKDRPSRVDLGKPRLPVDRVFSISGFGTIVTGTLIDGELHTGDEIKILPSNKTSRIRGLQTHKQKEDRAVPGSRTAINISGVSTDEIKRGNVIVLSGSRYEPSSLIDVNFHMLANLDKPLTHNTAVRLFIGAAEEQARLRLLGKEDLLPGESGWLQLDLKNPVIAESGDHFILRRPSPGQTLGGGIVVDPHPRSRHKRFDKSVIASLEMLSSKSPADLLLQVLLERGPAPISDIVSFSRLGAENAGPVIAELLSAGQLIPLDSGKLEDDKSIIIAAKTWQRLTSEMISELNDYYRAYPLRKGIPREQLKNRLKLSSSIFNLAVKKWIDDHDLDDVKGILFLPGRTVSLAPRQQATVDKLLKRFSASPFTPPTIAECQTELGEEVYRALVESDILIPVSNEIVFYHTDYERLRNDVINSLKADGSLTVAAFRDRYQTSRRYALAFLEHLDAKGLTIRKGDNRIIGKQV